MAVSVVTNTILHLRAIENQMTTVKRAMRYSHAFSSPAIIEGALASLRSHRYLGFDVMVTVAEADLVLSVTDVAVRVTVFSMGTLSGA